MRFVSQEINAAIWLLSKKFNVDELELNLLKNWIDSFDLIDIMAASLSICGTY